MSQDNMFSYKYSAKDNMEIEEIRKKYLPKSESKLEELKRLDGIVQNSGMVESLCAGIGGLLVFGLGMCLAMQVIGSGVLAMVFGVLIGIVGIACMGAAYPVYRLVYRRTKEKYASRILELAEEISGEIKSKGEQNNERIF